MVGWYGGTVGAHDLILGRATACGSWRTWRILAGGHQVPRERLSEQASAGGVGGAGAAAASRASGICSPQSMQSMQSSGSPEHGREECRLPMPTAAAAPHSGRSARARRRPTPPPRPRPTRGTRQGRQTRQTFRPAGSSSPVHVPRTGSYGAIARALARSPVASRLECRPGRAGSSPELACAMRRRFANRETALTLANESRAIDARPLSGRKASAPGRPHSPMMHRGASLCDLRSAICDLLLVQLAAMQTKAISSAPALT